MHCSAFLTNIFDIFVHLSSNHIGHISPWIIYCPCNLGENGNESEVPVWWSARELDLFSAHHYLGIPGGGLYVGEWPPDCLITPQTCFCPGGLPVTVALFQPHSPKEDGPGLDLDP